MVLVRSPFRVSSMYIFIRETALSSKHFQHEIKSPDNVVLRIMSADSQHKRGLTLLFFPPLTTAFFQILFHLGVQLVAVSIWEYSSCQGCFSANQLVPLSLCHSFSLDKCICSRTNRYPSSVCHQNATIASYCRPQAWPDAKVKSCDRPGSGSPESRFSSIFLFPVQILTVCKQIHGFLQTAASRITPPKPPSPGAEEVTGGGWRQRTQAFRWTVA